MQPPLALRTLGPSARGHVRYLVGASGLGLLGVVVDLARPWPLAFAVDHAIGTDRIAGLSPTGVLLLAALALIALTTVFGLIDMASVLCAERTAERIGATLRQSVFERSLVLSPRWHDRMRSSEIVSRLTTDVGRLLDALVSTVTTLLPESFRLGLVLLVLATLDPELALVAMAVVPVLMVFAVRQRRRVRQVEQEARSQSGRLARTATDLLRNVRAVQIFGRSPRAVAVFGRRNDALRAVDIRAVTTEAQWTPVADIVLAVGSGLVLLIGGEEVIRGRLSTGDLLVVISYLSALYSPIRGLSRLSGLLAKSAASAARIADVLDSTERVTERPDPLPAPRTVREVRFASVTFGYRPGAPVLRGFDLTVRAGETVALVGASGCGKSTALSLLPRLYDVDAGSITIDGLDVRDLALADLRALISYVPQDPWLFDTTIAENIAFGSAAPTRREILAAGRLALVDEFALALPDGYDTVVGEAGARLSGGQRRRVALARAAVSDAPIVLLDEPTASLDQCAAAELVRAITRATAGRTVLLVTHDLDLAATADRVVVLDDEPASVPAPVRTREEVTS